MLEAEKSASPDIGILLEFTPSSKSTRLLNQRQNHERSVHLQKQRTINKERQAIKEDIEREEKDMIKQLLRLEEEKYMLWKRDELSDKGSQETVSDISKPTILFDELVNPYPVTLPGGLSLRRRFSLDVLSRSNERLPAEYEDIDSLPSNGRLPPLVTVSGTSSSGSLNGNLQRSCSWAALHGVDKPTPWQGDPEAIDSIRRPLRGLPASPRSPGCVPDMIKSAQIKKCLKSICRSQSLKEKRTRNGDVMMRSQSVKEKCGPNDVMMRSKSLKEWSKKPVSDITEALSDCHISDTNSTFYRRGAMRARHPPMKPDTPTSGPRKDLVQQVSRDSFGDANISELNDVSNSTILQRRHKNTSNN